MKIFRFKNKRKKPCNQSCTNIYLKKFLPISCHCKLRKRLFVLDSGATELETRNLSKGAYVSRLKHPSQLFTADGSCKKAPHKEQLMICIDEKILVLKRIFLCPIITLISIRQLSLNFKTEICFS